MAIRFEYQPPARDARLLLAAIAPDAVKAAADHLLAASQPLVPVEHGDLRASGRVVAEGHTAHVTYGEEGQKTNDYAVVQHEHLEFHHPNGGQAKYLEAPMHSEADAAAAAMAALLRAAFQ